MYKRKAPRERGEREVNSYSSALVSWLASQLLADIVVRATGRARLGLAVASKADADVAVVRLNNFGDHRRLFGRA